MIPNLIRNVGYPCCFCFGVGSLWTLAWANHVAAQNDRVDPPANIRPYNPDDQAVITPVPAKDSELDRKSGETKNSSISDLDAD